MSALYFGERLLYLNEIRKKSNNRKKEKMYMELHYFVAITLPNHIKEMLYNYKRTCKRNYNFVHGYIKKTIILPFHFRECNGGTIRGNKNGLQTVAETKELSFTLQGFSTFGREDQPRIFGRR